MVLTGIDRFLLSLTLRAEEIEHQYSQRAGRLMQKIIIWGHERFGSIRRTLKVHRKRISIICEAGEDSPMAIPRYPALFLSNQAIPKTAEELVQGAIQIENGTTIRVEDLSWLQDPDPFGGTYSDSKLLFYSLEWVRDLITAYQKTSRLDYLTLAKTVTQKWISQCLYKEGIGEIWSDHETALRSIILCQLWIHFQQSELEDSTFMSKLCEAIIRHGEKLSHPSYYRKDHNHGIVQAYGLFAIGLCFPNYPLGEQWEVIGRERLEAQMAENVSHEGLHREHSPYYHFFVFRHFFYAYQLAEAYGKTFSAEFIGRLQTLLRAGGYLIKPNGGLSALGDTSKSSPILIENDEREEWPVNNAKEFLYCSSMGREGCPPDQTSVFFPQAGFASLRSGWGITEPFDQERYMLIRTATFPTAHIHRDVGSFELYGFGSDLIVDSGGPYSYGHPIRSEYFMSTHAHNTVVVDGQDQEVGAGTIHNWETNEQYDFLQLQHSNYPGISHHRSFIFVRPDYLIILDKLDSQHVHHYSQLFHLNENLQVIVKPRLLTTENSLGGATLQVVPFLKKGLGLRLHQGSLNPGQGWRCLAEKSMTPNTVLDYHQVGRSARFGVLLVPEQPNCPLEARVETIPDESLDTLRIRVSIGTRLDDIVIPMSGSLTLERIKE